MRMEGNSWTNCLSKGRNSGTAPFPTRRNFSKSVKPTKTLSRKQDLKMDHDIKLNDFAYAQVLVCVFV